ncbi:MAG: sigma-70 family RNA polymerase sigma factor [Planctomycetota bacterium]
MARKDLEQLLVTHLPDMVTLCNRMFPDRNDAEDAVQRAALAVLKALPGYRGGGSFRPWILKITLNAARDAYRARKRIRNQEKVMLEPNDPPAPEDGSLEERERREVLRTAITDLPEELQAPIVFHFFHKLTQTEIANVLECTQKTVHTRIERAKEALQSRLSPGLLCGVPVLAALEGSVLDSVPASLTTWVQTSLAGGAAIGALAGKAATAAAAGGALLKAKLVAGALVLSTAFFSAGVMVSNVMHDSEPEVSTTAGDVEPAPAEGDTDDAGTVDAPGVTDGDRSPAPPPSRKSGETGVTRKAPARPSRRGPARPGFPKEPVALSLDEKLHQAVKRGDRDSVKDLLDKGADVHSVVRGDTPLIVAVTWNKGAVAKYLLSRGARPNDINSMGHTACMIALRLGYDSIARNLLEKGADVHRAVKDGKWSTLAFAIYHGRKEIESELRARGATISPDAEATIRLLYAARVGDLGLAGQSVAAGADVNAKEYWGSPVLTTASENLQAELVRFLIDRGAEVNPDDVGYTPLYSVVYESGGSKERPLARRMEIIRILLDAGARPDVSGGYWNFHRTPFHWSVEGEESEIFDLLLERGADSNAVFRTGTFHQTALQMAITKGNLAMVEKLLRRGADPNAKDSKGNTALAYAEKQGNAKITEAIKRAGGM